MFSALRRWDASTPGSTTEVRRAGGRVVFETCDPGTATRLGKDASQDAVRLVLTRTSLALGLKRAGVPTRMARCVARELVATYPVSKLVDPKFGANNPDVQVKIQQLAAACR
jgi:hypothetical protein